MVKGSEKKVDGLCPKSIDAVLSKFGSDTYVVNCELRTEGEWRSTNVIWVREIKLTTKSLTIEHRCQYSGYSDCYSCKYNSAYELPKKK
jgi:hypothetical protein